MSKIIKATLFALTLFLSLPSVAQLNTKHYLYVGRSRIYFKNYVGAIEYMNIVIQLKPHLPEPYFYRGLAKQSLEDYRGALQDYQKALEIKPFYPDAYMQRGAAHHSLEKYEEAIADYQELALKLNPKEAGIFNNLGITKAAMDDIEGAIESYSKAIELEPKSVSAYLNRSSARQMLHDLDGAIEDCDAIIKIRPHYAPAYLNRGLSKFEKEDFAGALRDYDECIKLDPKSGLAFNNRGIVKQKLGDDAGAIMDYDMAISLIPNLASAFLNRGIAKERLGKGDFETDFKQAVKLRPSYAKIFQPVPEDDPSSTAQASSQHQTGGGSANTPPPAAPQDSTSNLAQNTPKKTEKKKRKRNIIMVSETSEEEEGKIQNKNIDIELEPLFGVYYLPKDSVDYDKLKYYSADIERINNYNNHNPFLTVTNKEDYLTYWKKGDYDRNIFVFNQRIEVNDKEPMNYLNRGIFNTLTLKYTDAINDFNKVVKMDEKLLMAYFCRAHARAEMVDYINSLESLPEEFTIDMDSKQPNKKPENEEELVEQRIEDYEEVMADLSLVLYINPSFIFALYNRANIRCHQRDFINAVEDYSQAIKIEPDFAEAYYNRGLTRIYLDDIEGGAQDLSKAGELGISEAYNVIKRYCN